MPEGGRYAKLPRPESISYFIRAASSHKNVSAINQINPQLYEIKKKNGDTITVHLTNIYIVSEAEFYEILSQYHSIDCIVTISNWNSWTLNCKDVARSHNIGVFVMEEFLSALHYDGSEFVNYISRLEGEKRESEARRRKAK